MSVPGGTALRRLLVEGLAWLLVLVGLAALVLPGPGLLALFAGLALLSQRYDWARRRVEPVRERALTAARQGVASWPRILTSLLGCALLVALGVVWGLGTDSPEWWPVADRWWLPGGWGTGSSLIGSGLIALAMVAYSVRAFRR